jgi:hypothetical protein
VAVDALREMLKAAPPTQVATAGVPTFWRVAALALGVIAVAEGGFIGWKLLGGRGTGTAPGNVRLDSKPEGAQVKIDGESKGVTPLSTSLSSGPHVLELSTGGEPRVIPITVNAGETLGQYVELSGAPSLGRLSISSQPGGATVLLDGQPRGTRPRSSPTFPRVTTSSSRTERRPHPPGRVGRSGDRDDGGRADEGWEHTSRGGCGGR